MNVLPTALRGGVIRASRLKVQARATRQGGIFQRARWRLVIWNLIVLSVILVTLELVVYNFFSHNVYQEVDQQLQTVQAEMQLHLSQTFQGPTELVGDANFAQQNYRIVVTDVRERVMVSTECSSFSDFNLACPSDWNRAASPDALVDIGQTLVGGKSALPNDIRTVHFRGQWQRVLTFAAYAPNGTVDGIVQLSRTVEPERASLRELRQLLLGGSAAGIFISILGSVFLATRALRPIRQAFARQRQFTADASHELRTPLALIRANAEILCLHSDRLAEEDASLIPEIINETDHLNRLIGNLLTLARADADVEKIVLTTRPVDLGELVGDVHEDIARLAEARGIETSLTIAGPVTVRGDETRLRQLLLILLDNALKYTDSGGRVDVSLTGEDNRARLTISDTGIGIPAPDLPHIFERFYRVDRAREHASGGTGLGLAIACWIVQAHHGNVDVASEVGKGTEVRVSLPGV